MSGEYKFFFDENQKIVKTESDTGWMTLSEQLPQVSTSVARSTIDYFNKGKSSVFWNTYVKHGITPGGYAISAEDNAVVLKRTDT